jgi:hypothetical protein
MLAIVPLFLSRFIVFADLGPLETELSSIISSVSSLLVGLGITVCVLGIVVGGLMRATAFGNERKVAMSNAAIACAVVGLVIVLLASTIASGIGDLV